MCNLYRLRISPAAIGDLFRRVGMTLAWPDGGTPNLEPRDEIHIRDTAPIIRRSNPGVQLSMLPWAWPGPGGKPAAAMLLKRCSDDRSMRGVAMARPANCHTPIVLAAPCEVALSRFELTD